jgi:hypothetical protein
MFLCKLVQAFSRNDMHGIFLPFGRCIATYIHFSSQLQRLVKHDSVVGFRALTQQTDAVDLRVRVKTLPSPISNTIPAAFQSCAGICSRARRIARPFLVAAYVGNMERNGLHQEVGTRSF